jgi:hypothetical protein
MGSAYIEGKISIEDKNRKARPHPFHRTKAGKVGVTGLASLIHEGVFPIKRPVSLRSIGLLFCKFHPGFACLNAK